MKRVWSRLLAVIVLLSIAVPARAVDTPLSVRRGADAAIVDAQQRTVLLRGVNLNALGDYYQANPAYPTVISATDADFARMESLGLNVVRLILSWSYLEPQPGVIDEAYIARIKQFVALAKKHKLYTVLDMHQDAWGKYIASNGSEQCGFFDRSIGWDGAPKWATLTNGASTCKYKIREASPAVALAFENFWRNKNGIQDHLIAVWARLAKEFATETSVAGYDLINEPNFGVSIGVGQTLLMGHYYTRALSAIRQAEKAVPGGFSHIGFIEPSVEWSAFGATLMPLGGFIFDKNIVFAPHLYAGSITVTGDIPFGYQAAIQIGVVYQAPVWSGEWGWFGDAASSEASIWKFAQYEDQYRIGTAAWQWKQACGDPHTQGRWDGQSISGQQNQVNVTWCPGDIDLGVSPAYQRVLSRAYPRHAPGRLLSLSSDPYAGTLTLTGHTDAPGQLLLWVPESTRVAAPVVKGGSVATSQHVAGGYRMAVKVAGDYAVSVGY